MRAPFRRAEPIGPQLPYCCDDKHHDHDPGTKPPSRRKTAWEKHDTREVRREEWTEVKRAWRRS